MSLVSLTPTQRRRAILAVAASMNSTSLYHESHVEHPANVRAMVLGEMEDYFVLSPVESSQFDKETTLHWVRNVPLHGLVRALDEMGKNPFSDRSFHVVADANGKAVSMWEAFVDAEMNKLNQEESLETNAVA